MGYSDNSTGDYSFCVGGGDGKGDMVPQKVYCCIDCGNFVSSHSKKKFLHESFI